MDFDLPTVFKPHFHFAFAPGLASEMLESLAKKFKDADCFVMFSQEYNHAMSPALADLLNHFRSSSFSFKPSAIATYSAGQWGWHAGSGEYADLHALIGRDVDAGVIILGLRSRDIRDVHRAVLVEEPVAEIVQHQQEVAVEPVEHRGRFSIPDLAA